MFCLRERLCCRILLDQARLKIAREEGRGSWEEFRNGFEIEALKLHLLERFSLPDGAASLICEANEIRREGDEVAHDASEDDIRDAILQQSMESGVRKKLERIFKFYYNKDV